MFIYNDPDVLKITSMNMTRDNNLLMVCDKKESLSNISIYNVSKLNFSNVCIFRPKRKIVTSIYSEFIYASFSTDGNYIASLGLIKSDTTDETIVQGVIWDVQIMNSPNNPDNYKPKCIFDLPKGVNKITLENKIICTSGSDHFAIWQIYENTVKSYKQIKNLNSNGENFVDHDWIVSNSLSKTVDNNKIYSNNLSSTPLIAAITESNDIYILEGISDARKANKVKIDNANYVSTISKFVVKQHIVNCFSNYFIKSNHIKSFSSGLVVGSTSGNLFFLERINLPDQMYKNVRDASRQKVSEIVGLSFNFNEEYLAVGFSSNEICTIGMHKLFDYLKDELLEDLKFDVVCDGFHQGAITSMDVALQRPIIVTSSIYDNTIRVWNYLTGHCEYCKVILTEKDGVEKDVDILAVAVHPNGYYIAVSDKDMIRFFHLCFKELRYYNNDVVDKESSKTNCHLIKFSNGGHLLAAVSNKSLYIIKSYSRQTLKEFKTPHTNTIKSVYFDNNDYYVYTVGSEGLVVEYNLFDLKIEDEYNSKTIISDGCFCINEDNKNIISIGNFATSKSAVFEISKKIPKDKVKDKDSEKPLTVTKMSKFNKKLYSVAHINSKKYDIKALVAGGEDGSISLYKYPLSYSISNEENNSAFNNNNSSQQLDYNIEFDFKKAHRSPITFIFYNRDTNLIFTAGEDGNLFIYCLYELPDGESISCEDHRSASINQLTAILDEGLGENVLFPINKISSYERAIDIKKEEIIELKVKEKKNNKEYEKRILEKENECNKNKDKEIREMEDKNKEMNNRNESIVEFYENKIKNILYDHNKLIIEKERQYNEKMDHTSNIIHDLNSKLHFQASDNELELKKKDDEYEEKFRLLESELRKKFDELKLNNNKLTEELNLRHDQEIKKFTHIDKEHEQELFYKQEKYENELTKLKEEISKNQNEIKQKTDQLAYKEAIIIERENDVKKLEEQRISLTNINEKLRYMLNEKEGIVSNLKIQNTETEKYLQEEKKIAGFSSKLKNELYRRNNEIMSNYNKQQSDINEMKTNTKSLETELEESLKLLENYEKELNKNKILISELKSKCNSEHKNFKDKEKEMDNLLQKIYDTFKNNDKNKIIQGIQEIHNLYLTGDVVKKIDSEKLNVNIKDELEKQIDFLQKSLINVTELRGKKEVIQKSEILRRTSENSTLINELNRIKKEFEDKMKDFIHLKSENEALKKTVNNYKRIEKNMLNYKQSNINNLNITNKSNVNSIFGNQLINNNIINKGKNESDILPLLVNNEFPFIDREKIIKPNKGKIYTGSNAVRLKVHEEQQKIAQILHILEEKSQIIINQKLEIQRLKEIIEG